jgi:hypothetical protein
MEIEKHLKKYGYNIKYSYDDKYCTNSFEKVLGKTEYNKFWKMVDLHAQKNNEQDVEQYIRDYLKNNTRALKILIGGQILISVKILESLISFLNNEYNGEVIKRVLDLGGSDGWSADYLQLNLTSIQIIDVLDKNYLQDNKNEKIKLINADYAQYNTPEKYDLIYSILGIEYNYIEVLIDCIMRNLKNKGLVFLGLRIQPYQYDEFQSNMIQKGFLPYKVNFEKLVVNLDTGIQTIPLFIFSKNE